jgi:hypothetical protein
MVLPGTTRHHERMATWNGDAPDEPRTFGQIQLCVAESFFEPLSDQELALWE